MPESESKSAVSQAPVHAIRQSLLIPPRFLGLTFDLVGVEGLVLFAVFAVAGMGKVLLLAVVVVAVGVHPVLVWATRQDPLALSVFLESMAYQKYYPCHASLVGRPLLRARGALPRM